MWLAHPAQTPTKTVPSTLWGFSCFLPACDFLVPQTASDCQFESFFGNDTRAGDVAQFGDVCSIQEALGLTPTLYKPSVVVHACNSTT